MTKKKGQGFARRVTLDNLSRFAPLLGGKSKGAGSDDNSSGDRQSRRKIRIDPALREAESLFQGEPIQISIPFKSISVKKSKAKSAKGKRGKPARAVGVISPRGRVSASPRSGVVASILHGPQRWEKVLSKTDAQRQKGNPTGDIRLTQAKWKEGGRVIDRTTYFRRDLFGSFRWIPKNEQVEEAKVPFDVTILGKNYGVLELMVSHKPSGEAGQGNYTTGIQWGDLSEITRRENLEGSTLKLYGPPKGDAAPFFIEIE